MVFVHGPSTILPSSLCHVPAVGSPVEACTYVGISLYGCIASFKVLANSLALKSLATLGMYSLV